MNFLSITGSICALVMVIGSLLLLYKGAITLKDANPDEAIKIEFKKQLAIQTRYPALGLFVLGVCFLVISFWYADRAQKEADDLQKQLKRPIVAIEIPVKSNSPGDALAVFDSNFGGSFSVGSGDVFRQEVPIALDKVDVLIRETGYQDWKRTIHPAKDAADGKVTITANLEQVLDLKKVDAEVQQAKDLPPLPSTLIATPTPGL